jgi:hypothetical protein
MSKLYNTKRNRFLILLLFLIAAAAVSADVDPPLMPVSPQIMGQGGSAVATAGGYEALFANPAGFVAPKGEGSLTFYTSTFWLYGNPLLAFAALIDPASTALQDYVDDQLASGGFGFGNADAVAFVGRGFGLGGLITIDTFLPDAAATGYLMVNVAFIGGYAFPIRIKEAVLKFGVDFRPMIRILAPMTYTIMSDFVDAFQTDHNPLATLNSTDALHGTALGIDLGIILEWEQLRWGLAFRDFLGTRFRYTQDPFGDILVSLRESGSFPSGGTSVTNHYIPMDVSTGFAYDFDFPESKRITDLVLYWSLDDIVTMVIEERPASAVLHAGAELELFDRWQLRAGFNQGYLTFGTGIQFWIMDVNLAFFTRETGTLSNSEGNPGLTLEVAFRQRPPGRRRADRIAREREEEEQAGQSAEQPAEGSREVPVPEESPAE